MNQTNYRTSGENLKTLSKDTLAFAMSYGASAAGISTLETLKGGPPSVDITYVMKEARSAISFAVPLNQEVIPSYLAKKDRTSHEKNNLATIALASGISLHLAAYLEKKGWKSVPVLANFVYRDNDLMKMIPDLSHRYLAVRSGVGFFGWSGNVLTPKEGAGVMLGSVVTSANLIPTDPIPEEQKFCDSCRLCLAACGSRLMDRKKMQTVTLGDREFSHSLRRTFQRCVLVCGGLTGLHSSGRWSTWSPGRFRIPNRDEEFLPAVVAAGQKSLTWPERPESEGGFVHADSQAQKNYLTCGNCQLLCVPDKNERKKRYKMLTTGGVIVQEPDGSLVAVTPEAAKKWFAAMSPEDRKLYEDTVSEG